ncbi:hypothetical protein [Candidatus Cryosericum odellii]|jgi:hypothetical protein|uniref:Uncharacterized protein n=1 Tax=Candidatus Cryosericum odellii TaxID=2290917 RepID=A0A398D5J7_9BACT|nr:hypothetical protein [Candidatus Cryosericum odellii]RIE06903.1 hypothetical protein SMC6_08115 [Candidatus Cryosericum odellii]RIE07617.1 hypothetical protein SMC5_09260 [Candidatus Cryosericum odellii]
MKTTADTEIGAGLLESDDVKTRTSQRHIRGWLFVCAVARGVVSSAVLAIGASTVDLKSFDRGNIPQEAALLLLMALGFWSFLMITPRKGEPVVHSMPRLQATTVLSLLALLSMVAAGAFGVQAGGGAPSIGLYQPPAVLAQTARHLEWLWWGAAAGMVFMVVAVIAQPWSLHLRTSATVCILAAEASTLILFLCLHNTFAALGVILLHLTAANALWSTELWRDEPPDADSDHDERWLQHHQGNV